MLLPGLLSHGIPVLFTGSGLRIAAVFCIAIYFVFISAPGNEEKKIVCFGDSLTSCGGKNGRYSDMLQKSLPSYIFINSGKGGDTIGGGLARLETTVLKHRAGYLIIGLGANDYWQQKRSLYELKQDYDTILARCHAAGCYAETTQVSLQFSFC